MATSEEKKFLRLCYKGDLDGVTQLLSQNPKLINTIEQEQDDSYWAQLSEHVVQYVLGKEADPKERKNRGHTPLLLAVSRGHVPVVRYLVEKGADLKKRNNYGFTPLLLAASKACVSGEYFPVLQYLVEAGADVNEKSSIGTALSMARFHEKETMIRYLVEKGAK